MVKLFTHVLAKYGPHAQSGMVQAYCVKCREKRDIKDPQETQLKNGRPAVKGTCPDCGTKMFRIGKP
ncbi:conserved hypothetical protein [Nitrosopumilaceae archaeon]|nr:conserved hypothetical protein [Nitrosopumilaceae archaeon]